MTKRQIREQIKARIAEIDADSARAYAHEIALRLAAFGWRGKRIMLYHALADEVDTSEAARLLREDNELFYPVVDGDDMLAAREGATAKGAFGIDEPTGKRFAAAEAALDVCVIPLRAFDAKCARLGRGKGYYDRFLAHSDCVRIAVAYDQQMVDEVPTEPHDAAVDAVVTPTGIYRR